MKPQILEKNRKFYYGVEDKIKQVFTQYNHEIALAVGMFFISCISFAAGYLYAAQSLKEPLQFEGFYESESTK